MKITKEKWEEIKKYVYDHSKEIWDTATSQANTRNTLIWLSGIKNGDYKPCVYPLGTKLDLENNLVLYKLNSCDEYGLFLEDLNDYFYWEIIMYVNDVELVEGQE